MPLVSVVGQYTDTEVELGKLLSEVDDLEDV